jgi:YD repeat-containing protein
MRFSKMTEKTIALAFTTGLLLTGFFSTPSYALVDLKNANFSDAWVDLTLAGTGYDLKVERAYNSRTLFNGIFGFGWCSDFETNLEVTPEGNLKLSECGAGAETIYQASGFSEKDIDKTVKNIIEHAKKENSTASPNFFSELDHKLRADNALRGEYANKYGISRPVADKAKFFANGVETDYIEKNGSNYIRTTNDGSIQKFTLKGKLEKIYDRNGNYLTLTYEGRNLRDVTDNTGRKISFSFYDNGKVKTISGPNGVRTEYKFKNLNDLVYVKAATGNVFTYEYDDVHNLTKISFPDKTSKEMTYNKNMDWVTGFKDIDGCKETYDYKSSTDSPKDHFWATVEKKCQSKLLLKAKYEFWYEMNSHKTSKFLKRSRTEENKDTTDAYYNELGKPITVARNGKTAHFEYFDNGLLKKRVAADGVVTTLKYDNAFRKVSHLTRGTKSSDFNYDGKGNLIHASNSDGQKITLVYDPHGRISVIEDQAHRKVAIKYEERFGKPSFIERDGLGSINVTYNGKGEVTKVTSPAGATVAIQVASTFSNLLDLIAPSGVNLTF